MAYIVPIVDRVLGEGTVNLINPRAIFAGSARGTQNMRATGVDNGLSLNLIAANVVIFVKRDPTAFRGECDPFVVGHRLGLFLSVVFAHRGQDDAGGAKQRGYLDGTVRLVSRDGEVGQDRRS